MSYDAYQPQSDTQQAHQAPYPQQPQPDYDQSSYPQQQYGGQVQPWQPQYPQQQVAYPQQPQYPMQQPYGGPAISPRSPALGLIVSIFLPGVGSMMAGRTGKGIAILLGYLISYLLMLLVIGFVLVPVFWILGMVFGYTDAVAWNRDHGIIS